VRRAALLVALLASAARADQAACDAAKKPEPCLAEAAKAKEARDWKSYTPLLARACELGSAASCLERAEFATDRGEAARFRRLACDKGDMTGCEYWGKQLQKGEGVPADPKKGTALIEKACKGKAAGACRSLAMADPNSPRYVELMKKACEYGDRAVSCVGLGNMYTAGERVKADEKQAKKYYALGCTKISPQACEKAGLPVPKD
jgi:TPR repeat protein